MKRRLGVLGAAAAVAVCACFWGGPDECAPWGFSTLHLAFVGLPDGVSGYVNLRGAQDDPFDTPGDQRARSGKRYVYSALESAPGPLVRTTYLPAPVKEALCLTPFQEASLTVSWSPLLASHRVWVLNGGSGSGQLLGYPAEVLLQSGVAVAAPSVKADVTGDLAFDRLGNLWSLGTGAGAAPLVRYPEQALGAGGSLVPDRGLALPAVDCGVKPPPHYDGLAFDSQGNLYVSSACGRKVFKFLAASLLPDAGVLTPALTLSDLDAPTGLAFDRGGNLLVADPAGLELVQYQAAALAGTSATAAARWRASPADGGSLLSPSRLAFDLNNTAWVVDATARRVFPVGSGSRVGAGVVPVASEVKFNLPAGAQPGGVALDEDGGLWLAYGPGTLVRWGPDQLSPPTDAGPQPVDPTTVITSPDLGLPLGLALYPGPTNGSLYSCIPKELR